MTRSGTGYMRFAAVTIALLWTLSVASAVASDEATRAAGFIVDTGEGEPAYVVVTYDKPMTAIDLLHEADIGAVTVDFGGLGEGVCEIRSKGCDVGTCRQRLCQTGDPESPFWQYWRQDDDGWSLSPLGGGDVEPADGEIDAWVWIGTTPDLAAISWDDLAMRAGAPDAIVGGNVSGDPAVYASADAMQQGDERSAVETVVAGGAVALVIVAGGALVLRQRRMRAPT